MIQTKIAFILVLLPMGKMLFWANGIILPVFYALGKTGESTYWQTGIQLQICKYVWCKHMESWRLSGYQDDFCHVVTWRGVFVNYSTLANNKIPDADLCVILNAVELSFRTGRKKGVSAQGKSDVKSNIETIRYEVSLLHIISFLPFSWDYLEVRSMLVYTHHSAISLLFFLFSLFSPFPSSSSSLSSISSSEPLFAHLLLANHTPPPKPAWPIKFI